MSTIHELYERVKALDTDKVSVDAVTETKDEYRDLNKAQLFKGLNALGYEIGIYASKDYAVYKNYLNPIPGFGIPDLKVTGAFYNGIKTEVNNRSIITESTDSKNAKLVEQYGEDIFGLNAQSGGEYVDKLRPVFNRKIELATGLKFN